jgi:hypothetical protein
MTKEEIIEMARQAGLDPDLWNYTDAFETFARLVAEKEREACANAMAYMVVIPTLTHGVLVKLSDVVNAIRARSKHD